MRFTNPAELKAAAQTHSRAAGDILTAASAYNVAVNNAADLRRAAEQAVQAAEGNSPRLQVVSTS